MLDLSEGKALLQDARAKMGTGLFDLLRWRDQVIARWRSDHRSVTWDELGTSDEELQRLAAGEIAYRISVCRDLMSHERYEELSTMVDALMHAIRQFAIFAPSYLLPAVELAEWQQAARAK